MENIFTAKDIRERLKNEYDQFKHVNRVYAEIMADFKQEFN